MINNDQIDVIEREVTKIYNVTKDELMSYDKHKNISMARMMCIYILHKDFGVPSSYLSTRYHRTRRIIFSMCQKAGLIIRTYKEDMNIYDNLVKSIRESSIFCILESL